jgi:ABC-type nitrate/sulfonate/bicarbonate transport system ATPase subunit
MPGVIQVSNVQLEYTIHDETKLRVLQDINLNVDNGIFFTLIGPSGCGKSTLLNIIGGLVSATKGEVLVEGQKVVGPNPKKMGMVFQESTLLPWRTIHSNVEFPLEARGVPKAQRSETSVKYLGLVGLSKFSNFYPGQLSGGMQQRVAIARALAQEPDILLIDEPFGALDEQTRIILRRELTKIWQATKKTIVFVTHSLLEAAYLSDKIAVMSARPGRILENVDVTFPRPREPEAPELSEIRRRLWTQISQEADKQVI